MDIDLAAFQATPLVTDPFPHLMVPGFLSKGSLAEVSRDFPKLDMAGSFPPEELSYGPAFASLLDRMDGDALRQAVAAKFGIDLEGRPTLTTVRACTRERDGQIHRDSQFKLITLLLYLNEEWHSTGGRLRILRSADDLDDYAGEVPPEGGLLFAFQCTDRAWHGHKPFVGQRRALQMNYVVNEEMRDREAARHRFSAKVKKLRRLIGLGKMPRAA